MDEIFIVEFKKPNIPVIHNFDSQPENDTQVIKTKLIKQIYSPVRWLDTINLMRDMNVKTIIECGPSKVLCGLIKRISPEIEIIDLGGQCSSFVTLLRLSFIVLPPSFFGRKEI